MGRLKPSYDPTLASMSLGDHLEELRTRLILALLGLLVGTIISFAFGKHLITLIEKPYNDVMTHYVVKHAADVNGVRVASFADLFSTNLLQALSTDPNAPPLDAKTLRFFQQIYTQTQQQWQQRSRSVTGAGSHPPVPRLQILAPADGFVGFMKISFIAGLVLSAPWIFYQIWMFIAAGLYENERRAVQATVPFSAALFVVGALFFLWVVAPLSLRFFLTFGDMIGVSSHWTFQKYISFTTVLMLVFGIAFQTPIAIFILNRVGLVLVQSLKSSRKFVILGIFIIAALATPPDAISQVTLAIPLYALFELGILLCVLFNKSTETSSGSP